jgi:hypothetical protein
MEWETEFEEMDGGQRGAAARNRRQSNDERAAREE